MSLSLTVLLMDLGRLSSRTGPWSSSASANTKDTMRGSLKSGRACRGGGERDRGGGGEGGGGRKQKGLKDPTHFLSSHLCHLQGLIPSFVES